MRERLHSQEFRYWFGAVSAGAAIILFYFGVKYHEAVGQAFRTLNRILMPFIIGIVIAYLLCPIYNYVVRKTYAAVRKKTRTGRRALTFSRVIGSFVAMIVLFAVLSAFLALMVPHLFKTIVAIVEILPGRIDDLSDLIVKTLTTHGHADMAKNVSKIVDSASDWAMEWAEKTLLPGVGGLVAKISAGIVVLVKTFFNLLVGIIISVYILNGKEHLKANAKRFIRANFSHEHAEEIFDFGNFCNKTFGGFINGKIIDSIIIGFMCYGLMRLIHLPYPVLVSTIVGVTNIIPFFGPFIGAIPSAVLICVMNPLKALYFLIMILGLQQFDGNILGPKILGETTGLPSFWVMFAIILGGGLFGVLGMVLSVPVFAILVYYAERFLKRRLGKRGYKSETDDYIDFDKYGIAKEEIIPDHEEDK